VDNPLETEKIVRACSLAESTGGRGKPAPAGGRRPGGPIAGSVAQASNEKKLLQPLILGFGLLEDGDVEVIAVVPFDATSGHTEGLI
jgi:hypothetical protein